jgi:hypothetical protein
MAASLEEQLVGPVYLVWRRAERRDWVSVKPGRECRELLQPLTKTIPTHQGFGWPPMLGLEPAR